MTTHLSLVSRRLAGTGVAAALIGATFVAAPAAHATSGAAITGVQPGYGKPGATVTIATSGFDTTQPATVTFASAAPLPEPASAWNASGLQVQVPSDATTGKIKVAQSSGATSVSATSPTKFVVTVPATATTSVSRTRVAWPHAITVEAQVTDANGAVPDHWGRLQSRRPGGATWHRVHAVHTRKTDSNGIVRFRVVPTGAAQYRVIFAPTHADRAVQSRPSPRVTVIPRVTLHVADAVAQLSSVPVTGAIGPASRGTVELQQANGRHWKSLSTLKAHRGRFATHLSFDQLGTVKLRALLAADSARRAGVSPVRRVQVVHRTLQQGDSGSDVKALQRRLRQLHYDVGSVNGSFGFDTFHAVTAFQKVQGLGDDGEVGLRTWKALGHPKRLHLRHPIAGATAVEVNLAKQVVIIARNGKIWRIIDSSTAGGYYYTSSSGATEKAVTPTGHFSVQYKVDHWQHSALGYLYRPAYFTNTGYAIHGETAVPPYPASHGCVRITVPAMDRYYNTFYVGESVWIYGNPPPGHA